MTLSKSQQRMARELARLLLDYANNGTAYARNDYFRPEQVRGRTTSLLAVGGAARYLAQRLSDSGADVGMAVRWAMTR